MSPWMALFDVSSKIKEPVIGNLSCMSHNTIFLTIWQIRCHQIKLDISSDNLHENQAEFFQRFKKYIIKFVIYCKLDYHFKG